MLLKKAYDRYLSIAVSCPWDVAGCFYWGFCNIWCDSETVRRECLFRLMSMVSESTGSPLAKCLLLCSIAIFVLFEVFFLYSAQLFFFTFVVVVVAIVIVWFTFQFIFTMTHSLLVELFARIMIYQIDEIQLTNN